MYELVNTSLPNGLIAGTHGFATVAMTKGVSDVLRGRLENLCAYAHRTSVHDATYFQQNPVNWFHVTLPQGEHVVGCVAPAEFDYTGRTNRIARLRVFGSTEVPSVGGATVLLKERHWFVQPWQGDPRYLEEDRNTCGHLRMLNPVTASAAPTWESIFGSNGSRYAQQIAWQLESNLSSGGKAIYFKTSAAWDVSGERLLSLFSEVIDLLPASQRSRVTFATYPVAMPSGTSCNLRGVFDRDKIFDAASATQAWVDCENARVVHAEMLPTSGRSQPASQKTANKATPFTAEKASVVGGVPQTSPKATDASTPQRSYQNLILPQKKGPDGFVIGLIVATVIMLLAAGGFFYWMTRANKQQMEESGAAAAVEAEIKNLENEKEAAARLAKEKEAAERKERLERQLREEKQRQEKEAKEKAQKEADEAQRKIEKEKAAKDAKANADYEAEKAKKAADAKKHQAVAYLDATEFRRGYPSYDYDSLKQKCKDPFMSEDGCCVYYYSGSVVTNEPAGFKVNKNIPNSAPLRWGSRLEKRLEDLPLVRNGFVLWYNPTAKLVYIDLNRRAIQSGDGEQWFADSSDVNLAEKFFGPDPHFEELWTRYQGKKPKYLIDWKYNERCRSVKPISTSKATWTDTEMIAELQKRAVKDFDESIALAKLRESNLRKDLDEKLLPELQKLQSETNSMWEVWRAYQDESTKISTLNTEVKALKKKKPKNWEAEKGEKEKEVQERKNRQMNMIAEGSANPTGKPIKGLKAYANIVDLESKIKSKENAVEAKQTEVDIKRGQIAKAQQEVETANQSKQVFLEKFKDNIRKVMFTLRVEGEAIEK